jgi:LPS-assembly protein
MRKTTTWMVLLACCLPLAVSAAGKGRQLNWGLCPIEPGIETKPTAEDLDTGFGAVEGDEASLVENGVSTFTGNVELIRDGNALRTDKLTYDEPGEIVDAMGHTRLWTGTMFWEGEHANLDMGKDSGTLDNGTYRLTDTHGRGKAARIERDMARDVSKLRDVTYTTCPSGEDPSWEISAKKLFLDHREEWGSARNAVLRVRGIPVAYTPYISFPLTNRRKSGLLPPTFGGSRDSGLDMTVPYYWNIAPNYDATIAPRYLGTRGLMLGGEGRYLRQNYKGLLAANILPSDNKFDDEDRWLVQFRHDHAFDAGRGRFLVDFNNVSDKQYLEDFGNSLSVTSTRFLDRYAYLTYGRDWWSIFARVNSYQTVDRTIPGADRPYDYMPQVFYYSSFQPLFPHVNFQVHGETTYFDRADTVTGGRFNLRPFVSFPFESAAGFVVPRIMLDQTWYSLDGNTSGEDQIARTVPNFSIDSGLFFERDLSFAGTRYLHTIEPRIYYLYRPEVEQNDIPIFDTSEYDFSFLQLFRDNR